MEEVIKKILRGLSYNQLLAIKENPYLIDEVLYEKYMELKKYQKDNNIQSVGNNLDSTGNNWIDNQKMAR